MILELKIKNFLSFKEEVIFSFEATKDKTFEDYQVVEVAPDVRILRLGIVYGANASGKSNLLTAFNFLKDFWFEGKNNKDEKTGTVPFKLLSNEATEFALTFYIDKIKHVYNLVLTSENVIAEKLYKYPSVQPALIVERQLENNISKLIFNPKQVKISTSAINEIELKCLRNMSLFAAYNMVNVNVPEIETVITWMKKQFMDEITPSTRLTEYAENVIAKDNSIKNYMLDFLNSADFNISDFRTEEKRNNIPDHILKVFLEMDNDKISLEEKEQLRNEKSIPYTQTVFTHKVTNEDGKEEVFDLPENSQSEGTIRTFGLAVAIHQAVKRNAFLSIDEIESSLHPKLVAFFIENFFKQKGESQLLLTTHYDGLLEDDDLLRNDSIWFTNKKKNGSTELYPLTDFKGLNRISSLQKAYKFGKFGAIPNI